jgi:nucleotide-binding universal stress UspA family protein
MKIEYGEPAAEIVGEVKRGQYDLIVVGSRGLGPLGRLLLGSVSTEVLRAAPCPVLVAGAELSERIEPAGAT